MDQTAITTVDTTAAFFHASHSKRELAEMLALVVVKGAVPDVPHPDVLQVQPSQGRGRPAGRDMQEQLNMLIKVLDECFPHRMTLHELSQVSPLSYTTLQRLQAESAGLLPTHLGDYFRLMPRRQRRYRLLPIWRALLDMHNYTLLVQSGGAPLPLYALHASLWGAQAVRIATVTKTLPSLNANERERATRDELVEILVAAGWPTVEGPVKEDHPGCLDTCNILAAYPYPPTTIGEAHQILASSLLVEVLMPNLLTPLTPASDDSSLDVVRRIVSWQ